MKIHFIKSWPEFFSRVVKGEKPWEIRLDDRGYQIGDQVVMEEYSPTTCTYTGAWVQGSIVYMHSEVMGLKDGYVCFTFKSLLTAAEVSAMPAALLAAREAAHARAA